MITTFDLKYDMPDNEKADIIKELIDEGYDPMKEILVPIKSTSSKGGRELIGFITGQKFIDEHKELFD